MNNEKKYALAFSYLCNFSFSLYKKLISNFTSLEKAFFAKKEDFLKAGFKEGTLLNFFQKRKDFSFTYYKNELTSNDIKFCFISDSFYPKYLKNIYNPPPLFYYRGNLDINWDQALSIVGSRKVSFYGERLVNEFVPVLSQAGIISISGLALGIDSLVHNKSLASSGQTVAVLGSGLDKRSIYPFSNRFLAEEIVRQGGLLISEFPPGSKPLTYHFPQRNRIIAGLSLATVVLEAGIKSSSLITANYAIDEGRDVFSIPGDIFKENLAGNNQLLQKGAFLLLSPKDILSYFALDGEKSPKEALGASRPQYKPQNEEERLILELLRRGSAHIDEILSLDPQNVQKLSSSLSFLEINGVICNIGHKNYELI